ncbi:hypothetical protein AC625_03475 [Peribacillus loiseleuriae]|uniref:Uncharacterized protein n=1 Tax=Peribacillus loiseleuriae TaxID=1679170 RepID=A0A0K9GPR3_9BACI|nr:hypothetical protein AC625_03475 [Peribacillus loiseleuriae]
MIVANMKPILLPFLSFDQAIVPTIYPCKPRVKIVNGAQNVQPEIKSNTPIPTASAMAPFLGPNKNRSSQ